MTWKKPNQGLLPKRAVKDSAKRQSEGEGKMVQINGQTGQVEAELSGGERIFSREDTDRILRLTKSKNKLNLGSYIYNALRRQDTQAPEYVRD
jgi:hypothetical protein